MNKFNYKSIYAPYFEQFIAMKKGLGFVSLNAESFLFGLDKFFLSKKVKRIGISKQQIEQWRATLKNNAPRTIYSKSSILSQFCKYMCMIGYDCYVQRLPPFPTKHSFIPHIYTNQEIKNLFQACDHFKLYNRRMDSTLFIMPALVRLLYGTGLRISEALSLKNKDMDFDQQCLYIRKSKNGDERIAPLSETLVKVLRQYLHYRDRMPVPCMNEANRFFFASPVGSGCHQYTVHTWFRKALAASGIPFQGEGKGPRLHDLRHTFAVHSLVKMSKSGLDLYYSLPLLSTCLGHKSLQSTDRYVRLTAEVYQDILKDEKGICAHIFPTTKTIRNNGNN
jgi:integrase